MKSFQIFLLIFIFLVQSINLSAQHTKKDGTPDRRYKENKTTTARKSPNKPTVTKTSTAKPSHAKSTNPNIKRDKNGKIARSDSAKRAFMKQTGYPHGRKGYVIDHIIPLKKGGCDCPSNMQWQTVEEAKRKDKVEMP